MTTVAADKSSGAKPIVKKQFGNISVAVFAREVSKPDGTLFTAKDFVLQKSWKDKQGAWQDQSISLKGREILAVQEALTAAFVDSFDATEGDDE
jgi:hypothetical protein